MEPIVRTFMGNMLQTAQLLGVSLPILDYTTLNQKLDIQANTSPDSGVYPRMQYIAIGNGGHVNRKGADGTDIPDPTQHQTTDASPFKIMPFVLVTPDQEAGIDVTKYALRRLETWNNTQYVAYYLKRLDLTNVVPRVLLKSVQNGQTISTTYTPSQSNLNPTPSSLSSTGVNVTTGDYITVSAMVKFALDATDVQNLLNVSSVIHNGDVGYSIISELALVSGVDKIVQVQGYNGPFNLNEVIASQVVTHINEFYYMRSNKNGLDLLIYVGATEPLYKLSA